MSPATDSNLFNIGYSDAVNSHNISAIYDHSSAYLEGYAQGQQDTYHA